MFSGMRKSLKVLDFYQAVPTQLSQGTISGACISIVSISTLIMLTIYLIINFLSPQVVSDLIIDQKHLAQKLKVNIDIQMPRYPCSMLSLDVQNELKVHLVNINENLEKIILPGGVQRYNDKSMTNQEKLQRILKDVNDKTGCRMKGFFQIDRVPGNFHFSCHGYASVIPSLINQGHRNFDLTHKINELSFGQKQNVDYGRGGNSLGGFNSQKEIQDNFMGITYTYFLDIIENNQIDMSTQKTKQNYLYTARLNEVILAQFPMLLFRYETNPMTVLKIYQYQQWHTFFIDFIGVLGGIFTVSAIIDSMVHSSIRFLLDKHRQGKLI